VRESYHGLRWEYKRARPVDEQISGQLVFNMHSQLALFFHNILTARVHFVARPPGESFYYPTPLNINYCHNREIPVENELAFAVVSPIIL
jgi:hypothetical protein